jgi:hypothetical protein
MFEAVARAWHEQWKSSRPDNHAEYVIRMNVQSELARLLRRLQVAMKHLELRDSADAIVRARLTMRRADVEPASRATATNAAKAFLNSGSGRPIYAGLQFAEPAAVIPGDEICEAFGVKVNSEVLKERLRRALAGGEGQQGNGDACCGLMSRPSIYATDIAIEIAARSVRS